MIMGPHLELDPDTSVTTSQIAREDPQSQFFGMAEYNQLKAREKNDRVKYELYKARIKDELRWCKNSEVTSRVESGHLTSNLEEMRTYFDLSGKMGVKGDTRCKREGESSSELLLPLVTSYGRSVRLPFQAPRQSTISNGSVLGFDLCAIPKDHLLIPRESSGILE